MLLIGSQHNVVKGRYPLAISQVQRVPNMNPSGSEKKLQREFKNLQKLMEQTLQEFFIQHLRDM
uniref:Uncharacterized protein n=1 Tax=Yersinia enterocolitica TaxID=630 RepID=B0RL28_YEREN|nr:hypothetical protein [Yersinia enterocolitica]